MQLHDNYPKASKGYYVNSASVSAGKTLDKAMHESNLRAVAENLHSIQHDLE